VSLIAGKLQKLLLCVSSFIVLEFKLKLEVVLKLASTSNFKARIHLLFSFSVPELARVLADFVKSIEITDFSILNLVLLSTSTR